MTERPFFFTFLTDLFLSIILFFFLSSFSFSRATGRAIFFTHTPSPIFFLCVIFTLLSYQATPNFSFPFFSLLHLLSLAHSPGGQL